MSKKEKILERLKAKPKNFTYHEVKTLLQYYGFYEDSKGKTSGSRVKFIHKEKKVSIQMHKPHNSGDVLKMYQILDIINAIEMIKGGISNG